MLEFHPLSLADRERCEEIIRKENTRSADFSFANMFMWDERYRQLVAYYNGRLVVKLKYDELPFFAFPIGTGELKPTILAMRDFAASRGWPLRISGVTEENRELLDRQFPSCFIWCDDEDYYDYIYRAEALATFAGKKLHGKKNHCNRFEKEHEWEFKKLTAQLIPDCVKMLDAWTRDNAQRLHDGISDEHAAIMRGFENFDKLSLEGGVLFAEGEIIGFTVGEMLSDDTCDIHFEKARADINGAYTMVCREFARQLLREHEGLIYLNREDDAGIESLRASKQSYKPEFMLKKYTARFCG